MAPSTRAPPELAPARRAASLSSPPDLPRSLEPPHPAGRHDASSGQPPKDNAMNDRASHPKGGRCRRYTLPLAALALLLFSASTQAQSRDLKSFVTQWYVHGTPYAEAHAYGPGAIPELVSMLHDPAM